MNTKTKNDEMRITWLPARHNNVYYEVGFRRIGRWDWQLFGHRSGGEGKLIELGGFSGSFKSLLHELRESYGF